MNAGKLGFAVILLAVSPFFVAGARAQSSSASFIQTLPRPAPGDGFTSAAGNVHIVPGLRTAVRYDDNVVKVAGGAADFAFIAKPTLFADAKFGALSFDLVGAAEILRAAELDEEEEEILAFSASARYDATDAVTLTGKIGFEDDVDSRGHPNDVGGLTKTDRENLNLGVGVSYTHDKFIAAFDFDRDVIEFSDVTVLGILVNHDDQDRLEENIKFRLTHKLSKTFQPFVEVTRTWIRYDFPLDDFGFARDSRGFELFAGLTFSFPNGIEGTAKIGQDIQNFDDPILGTMRATVWEAAAQWQITEQLKAVLSSDRAFDETILPFSPGFLSTLYGVGLTYQVTTALSLDANFDYLDIDFVDLPIDFADQFYIVGASYKVNRWLDFDLKFTRQVRSAVVAALSFDANVVEFGVSAHF